MSLGLPEHIIYDAQLLGMEAQQHQQQESWLTNHARELAHRVQENPQFRKLTQQVLGVTIAISTLVGVEALETMPAHPVAEVPACDVTAGGNGLMCAQLGSYAVGVPETTILPPPVPAPKAAARSAAQPRRAPASPAHGPKAETDPVLPARVMPYEVYAAHAQDYINHLPGMPALNQLFGGNIPLLSNYAKQLEYIGQLNQSVNVTPDDYRVFAIDKSHNTAFKGVGTYANQIQPKLFIVHWTGRPYNNDPNLLAASMIHSGELRVDYYMDGNGHTYQLFESDHNRPAHALGINDFSQGVEIEASNMMEYKPEQIKQLVLLVVSFCRRNDIEINDTTVLGHKAADLIFANPYYNPASGTFSKPRLRKFDGPQELVNIVVAKAQALDVEIGPR